MLPFICLVLALIVAPQAVPPPGPPPPAQASADAYFYFIQGRMLEGRGDTAGAIAAHRKALELAPQAADIHAELAGVFARDGRATEATDEAGVALKIDPTNRDAHRILGLVDAAMAENAPTVTQAKLVMEAISHLEQASAEAASRDLMVELSLGRLYVQSKQYPKGIEVLKDFLLDQPGYPDAVMLIAEAYDSSGQTLPAIAALEDLVREEPTLTMAVARIAELDEQVGRWADAAARWDIVAKQTPRNSMPYRFRHAMALVNGGDLTAGRQALLDLTKDTPRDISLWYTLAQVEKRAGNAAGAEDAAHHITAIDSSDPRGALALADAKSAAHDFAGAQAILEPLLTTLQTAPPGSSLGVVAAALANVFSDGGDKAGAVRVLEDARRRLPDDVDVAFNLDSAYERAGRIDDAERVMREVLAKDPTLGSALNALSYLLADHGRKLDEAVTLIKRALANDADNPSYLDSLGWAYFKQGKYADAMAPLERAAAASQRASAIQAHLGEAYFQAKRYGEAAQAWTRALAGDLEGIDVPAVTKKRDRALELAK